MALRKFDFWCKLAVVGEIGLDLLSVDVLQYVRDGLKTSMYSIYSRAIVPGACLHQPNSKFLSIDTVIVRTIMPIVRCTCSTDRRKVLKILFSVV